MSTTDDSRRATAKTHIAPLIALLFAFAGILQTANTTYSSPVPVHDSSSVTTSASVASPNSAVQTAQATLNAENSWPMAGANPRRTSWTPEEIRGSLKPAWFKTFEPYIPQKVQIIAANNTLYISTARGLYALNADTGAERWVYPTEMPLGHSPTVHNGVVYVGGFDRNLHAIDASNGNGLWTFEADAGFQTNPLVMNGKVYAGSRDGTFYALHTDGSNAGTLAWKYRTDGPILFSAAYKDGVVFFASNDSHAYALDAETGALVWKSAKLPGAGFNSWWPVVYQDRVIFAGSNNYRFTGPPFDGPLNNGLDKDAIYPNADSTPKGTLLGSLGTAAGDWADGTPTVDAGKIMNYFSQKPWRRTVFVLDRFTGQERETAPVLWAWTHSGTRYPPVVGSDGVLYQQNNYMSDPNIPGGQVAGWQPGTSDVSVISSDWGPVDEPIAASGGGNLIYWNLCCDRQAGAIDITMPNTTFANRYKAGERPPTGFMDQDREWLYFNYHLDSIIPGYNDRYYNATAGYTSPHAVFGGPNGVYGFHADTNAPVPYNGKVYMHRSNAVVAFAPDAGSPDELPMAQTVAAPDIVTPHDTEYLTNELTDEVQKMLDAGHLRPGYRSHGIFDLRSKFNCGDALVDYWHNSSYTLYVLIRALPHLPADMQDHVKSYLQSEFTSYPPYDYNHIGWRDGAAREIFDLPPEVDADRDNYPPEAENYTFESSGGWSDNGVWGRNPFSFYALWKYAATFGDASTILAEAERAFWEEFDAQPSDTVLTNMPSVHNAYIAGYLGFLGLQELAGHPASSEVQSELDRLLQLRAGTFTADSAYSDINDVTQVYCRTLNVANNFMYLVPELADYLRINAQSKVEEALAEYEALAPYWFVSFFEGGYAENAFNPLYDAHAIFVAKALILGEPITELDKYLDVPGFARGDLFYINKLVAALENASFTVTVTPLIQVVDAGGSRTFTITIEHMPGFDASVNLTTSSSSSDLEVELGPPTVIAPPGGQTTLTITDKHPPSFSSPALYTIEVEATGGGINRTQSVQILVNGERVYLPLVNK